MAWEQSDLNVTGMGGGFMSPSGSKPAGRSSRQNEVVPVTAAMLHDTLPQAEGVQVGKHTAQKVVLVGIIRSRQREALYVTYYVDDTTGAPVGVREWLDTENPNPEEDLIAEGTYVRVIGNLRNFDGRTYLNAFNITPVGSMNEVTAHMLETELAKIYYTQDLLEKRQESSALPGTSGSAAGGGQAVGGSTSGHKPMDMSGAPSSGLDPVREKVYQSIRNCHDESGIGIDDLLRRLPQYKHAQMKEILEFLANEGHIYSSIDDDHYKSTDSI